MPLDLPIPKFVEPAPIEVPAWIDPRTMLMTCAVREHSVSFGFNQVQQLAAADPKRYAIGFTSAGNGINVIRVSPNQDPQFTGFSCDGSVNQGWFTVFTHGPLVSLEWWGYNNTMTQVTVWELYRLS